MVHSDFSSSLIRHDRSGVLENETDVMRKTRGLVSTMIPDLPATFGLLLDEFESDNEREKSGKKSRKISVGVFVYGMWD
jgi:hypothetical protein